jgi:hypothetical protein
VTSPNFGVDLRRTHLAITRGLQVSAEAADIYAHEGFPDEEMRRGFRLYVGALVAYLEAHHSGEQEIAWPFLQEHMPHVPYDVLLDDHHSIDVALEKVAEALDAGDMRIYLHLARLQEEWDEHRSREELAFSPEATAAALASEHQDLLTRQLAEHTQARAHPPETVVPFMLYNLPPEARTEMIQLLPPDVVQELIPGPWLESWAPMRPFLLLQS